MTGARCARRANRDAHAERMIRGSGSTSAVAAGAMRIGNTVGAVLTDRRVLGPVEWRLMSAVGLALCTLSVLIVVFPRVLTYPVAALGLWGGLALLWSAARLRRSPRPTPPLDETPAAPAAPSAEEGEG